MKSSLLIPALLAASTELAGCVPAAHPQPPRDHTGEIGNTAACTMEDIRDAYLAGQGAYRSDHSKFPFETKPQCDPYTARAKEAGRSRDESGIQAVELEEQLIDAHLDPQPCKDDNIICRKTINNICPNPSPAEQHLCVVETRASCHSELTNCYRQILDQKKE